MSYTAGGFQCGIGNLLGFKQAGFNIEFQIDNRKFIKKGIKTLTSNFPKIKVFEKWEVLNKFNPDVLIASPSCSQVSMLGMKRQDRHLLDNMKLEGFEFYLALKKIFETSPNFIVIEYLTKILDHMEIRHDGIYREVTNESFLFPKEYRAQLIQLNSMTYGVPQKRKRIFLFLSKRKYNFIYVPPSAPINLIGKNVGDILSNIESMDNSSDVILLNHEKPSHSQDRIEGFNKLAIGESYYGGQNNRRLDPTKTAPTITSHCTQYVHPWEPRVLTAREVATFQGFPYDFEFQGSFATQLDMIGRTVPPPMMKHFAEEIKICLDNYQPAN